MIPRQMQRVMVFLLAFAAAQSGADGMSAKQAQQYMERLIPRVEVEMLRPSAMPGVHEVVVGGEVYYLSGDGKFMLSGKLYNLETATNLTERTRSELRRRAVAGIGDANTIVYAPDDYQYTVNVFTDLDCAYCRQLHSRMDEINGLEIRVNYLLTPLRGKGAYRKAVSVWCADDRRAAFDSAKQEQPVAERECDNPVDANLRLAEVVGVQGTPAFLLANGQLMNGYRTPQELLEAIRAAGIQPAN